MKIHIVGASGAGKTTLAKALAQKLDVPHLDTDDYFWVKTEIAFTVKRDPVLRNARLLQDTIKYNSLVLEGSLAGWGEGWQELFDLVVFLRIPHQLRMLRLHNREYERYGELLFNDPERVKLYRKFTEWARGYDDNTTKGRTLAVHQNWLKGVSCPVLEVNGDYTTEEQVEIIIEAITVNKT
jgi:adenylate kinase family enzyme